MTTVVLRSCVLDRAGIPDLADLRDVDVDLAQVAGVSFHIAYVLADPQRPAFYPFAAVELVDELLLIPLERETRADDADDSIALLRRAFANTSITGIDSNTSNDNNASNAVITNIATNTRIANNAGYAGIASIPNRGDTPWQQQSTARRSRASSP